MKQRPVEDSWAASPGPQSLGVVNNHKEKCDEKIWLLVIAQLIVWNFEDENMFSCQVCNHHQAMVIFLGFYSEVQ